MRRALIALGVVIVLLGGIVVGVRVLWHNVTSQTSTGCVFGNYSSDTGQAEVAATMAGVVIKRGLPERAIVLALAAGLQESKLRNIPSGQGDRDSVGVLQQRPSQGWGTIAELSDVATATGRFLDHLVEVKNWQTIDLADAIQQVQNSIDGSLYDQHARQAQAMADVFAGTVARGITCHFAAPTTVATTTTVVTALSAELPVSAPVVAGRAITVRGASWTTASWFIAHADRYGIDSVAYSGGKWSRTAGWRDDKAAPTTAVIATMHP